MKLSKLIKQEYRCLAEQFPFAPITSTTKGFYRSGFEDGIFNMFLTMKECGVHPWTIISVIDTIDPEHNTVAWELAEEYYTEYCEQEDNDE